MSNATDYLEGKLLAHVFQGTAYTAPTTVYVALGTVGADGSFTELSGNGYARVAVTCNTTNWTVGGGVMGNGGTITFPAPTGHWNGGSSFGYFAIYDASTSGNALVWGALTTAQTVLSTNSAPAFAAGALTFTLNGGFSDYLKGKLLGHVFQNVAYTAPTTVYAMLGTAASSSVFTELSGGGYARVGLACNSTNWPGPTSNNGTVANGAALDFPTPTGHWNGGSSFGYLGLADASTSGNVLAWGALTTAQTVLAGHAPVQFPIGAVSFQIDN